MFLNSLTNTTLKRSFLAAAILAASSGLALAQAPAPTQPATQPTSKPVDAKPADTKPADAKPADTKPAADLPSAQSILDKYVTAIGGKDAIEKVKFRVVKGKITIAAANLSGTLEAYSKAPNIMKTAVDIPGIGKIERGTDGKVGWETNPLMGPRLLEGQELEMMLREADVLAELNYAKNFDLEVTGKEKVGDADAYVVKMTSKKDKSVSKQYFDVTSGYMVKRSEKIASQMGEMEAVSLLEDYKDFGGVKTPAKTTMKLPQMDQVMTIESVEFPADLGDDKFTLPADVKELVEKQAAEAKKPATDDKKPEEKAPAMPEKK